MHIDLMYLNLRNILAIQLLAVLTLVGNSPVVQRELIKIWKALNTPLLPKKPTKPNHRSGKFWEIDMTDFEP
jgi:hypothetical protein